MSAQPPGATPYCTCAQNGVTGLDELLDLLAYGFDQMTACRMLWGDPEATKMAPPRTPTTSEPRTGPG